MLREGVGELEGGYEDEGAAESEEEVAWNVAIEGCLGGKSEEEGTDCKEDTANDATDSRPVSVEDSADG